jgi:hypothetical protein
MSLDESSVQLEFRLGKMNRRVATVTGKRAHRLIVIDDCKVTREDVSRDLTEIPFEICAYEWKPGETLWPEEVDKIGALNIEGHLNVHLPPDAFGQLSAIADGSKASRCILIINVKLEPSQSVLSVTEVTLIEPLP